LEQAPPAAAVEPPPVPTGAPRTAAAETAARPSTQSIELPARTPRAGPWTIAPDPPPPRAVERRAPALSPSPIAGPPGSPTGLGLGRLVVRLDGPRARVTDREVETVSGMLMGGAPSRLVIDVNGTAREVTLQGRTFKAAVDLRPGLNTLRAVATDRQGAETVDAITVEYVPPAGDGIAITSPADGHTVGGDVPPLIVVEGRVDDPRVSTVWLVANERRIPVRAQGGRFRHALAVLEPAVRVWAEAPVEGAEPRRSAPVTVHSTVTPTLGVVVLDWPLETTGGQVEMVATWRGSADRPRETPQTIALKTVETGAHGTPASVFYLRNVRPGVYTFVLQYRAPAGASGVVPTLYVPEAGRLAPRPLRPVVLSGAGKVTVARILMPQGVLWDQDDWFTGQSQTGETVTKFRFPDGVSWTERKIDLR
jgi:hypothetical protein